MHNVPIAVLLSAYFALRFAVATGAAEPSVVARTSQTLVPAAWQALHDRWQAAVDELRIPGVAIVVVKGNEVVLLDAIGVCDPTSARRVTPESPFYLASVTKSFTALAIAVLVEEGKVSLDEPVRTYLPRFALRDEALAQKVTVRDLLCHRLGLNSDPIGSAEAYLGNITEDRYYRLLSRVNSRGEFAYSNLHYTLLGRIIAAVTGNTWQDFLDERVFRPLQMRESTCYASKLYANPAAAWPMIEKAGKWELAPLVKNDQVMHAAGGMGASARDLGNWLRFQLTGKTPDGRQLISPELLQEVHKQQVTMKKPDTTPGGFVRDGYSLGWFTGTFSGRRFVEHGGGYLGTATIVSLLPDEQIGVAVLVNESRPALPLLVVADVYSQLLDVPRVDLLPWLRETVAKSRARAAATPERTWQPPGSQHGLTLPSDRYVGTYSSPDWGDATVAQRGDYLTLHVGQLELRWHAQDNDRCEVEFPGEKVMQGRFMLEDGKVTKLVLATPIRSMEFTKENH